MISGWLEVALVVVFWACAGSVVYSYVLYPVLVFVLSRVFGRVPVAPEGGRLPRAALLIAAHNEAAVLEARIRNALETDYPAELFEVVIASDGSDDETAEICGRYEGRVRALLFNERRGKAAVLEDAVGRIEAEVVILSDANTFMDADAARQLARWFADPGVGAVCGRLVLTDAATGRNADGMYWKYETFLKLCEARLGALLGANGAIYAVRRELLRIPAGTIVDDFVIPLGAKLRTGMRVVYEPAAVAHEETAPDVRGEFGRRVRIGTGAWQSLLTLWPLLSPRHGFTALALWSHKVLRWACPFMMIGAFVASILLASRPLYGVLAVGQLVFHMGCVGAAVSPSSGRVLRLCGMFFAMNLALLLGFVGWVRGGQSGVWKRTARA
jgi:cellulose synthase/poly-beta-1,6-N-acetylglucosamine synthase-like glycosyltransferase